MYTCQESTSFFSHEKIYRDVQNLFSRIVIVMISVKNDKKATFYITRYVKLCLLNLPKAEMLLLFMSKKLKLYKVSGFFFKKKPMWWKTLMKFSVKRNYFLLIVESSKWINLYMVHRQMYQGIIIKIGLFFTINVGYMNIRSRDINPRTHLNTNSSTSQRARFFLE